MRDGTCKKEMRCIFPRTCVVHRNERSASRGQEPTPSPLSTRVEDRDEPAAQTRPVWRIETGQGGEAGADAPHASSRARRVERRLVGASVGLSPFGVFLVHAESDLPD